MLSVEEKLGQATGKPSMMDSAAVGDWLRKALAGASVRREREE